MEIIHRLNYYLGGNMIPKEVLELRQKNRNTICKNCLEQSDGKGDIIAMCYLCNGCPVNDNIQDVI